MRWIELASYNAESKIKKAVELDNFIPMDENHNFSSSTTDTIMVFLKVSLFISFLNIIHL